MEYSRIDSVIDVPRMKAARAVIVGVGGSVSLIENLVRSGLGQVTLIDPDRVELSNLARQGHFFEHLGQPKVEAAECILRRINPELPVETHEKDFTALSDDEIEPIIRDADLLVLATDRFAAQARGNQVALKYGIPAVFIGLYQGGLGGEISFWHPGLDSCHRCLCSRRYEAQARAKEVGQSLDPPSTGATVFDLAFLDSIVGMLCVGLLTRGADNRFGRLIDSLGDRNFLQVQIDPTFRVRGEEVVRKHLGVPAECDTFFAWNTIARRNPQRVQPCPDCVQFRGRTPDGHQESLALPPLAATTTVIQPLCGEPTWNG